MRTSVRRSMWFHYHRSFLAMAAVMYCLVANIPAIGAPQRCACAQPSGSATTTVSLKKVLAEAMASAKSMRGIDRASMMGFVAEVQAKAGNKAASDRIYQMAIKAASKSTPYYSNYWNALADIAKSQTRTGNVKGALSTVELLKPNKNDDDTCPSLLRRQARALTSIAFIQAEAGEEESAGKIFELAKKKAHATKTPRFIAKLHAEIATNQALSGEQDTAKDSLKVAMAIAKTNPGGAKEWIFQGIATAQAALGDTKEALATCKSITGDENKGWALEHIPVAQARAGDVPLALKTALAIGDDEAREYALHKIGKFQVETHDYSGALRTVALMKRDDIKDWALGDIAKIMSANGDKSDALKVAEDIALPVPKAKALAHGGKLDMALRTAKSIRDDHRKRARALIAVAEAMCEITEPEKKTEKTNDRTHE